MSIAAFYVEIGVKHVDKSTSNQNNEKTADIKLAVN